VALKRVCDITGSDRDVEICDVTIAGQAIKLDLSPAGVDRLREFFGSVVTVRHPHADSSPNELAPAVGSAATGSESAEEDEDETDAESVEEDGGRAVASAAEPAARESGPERSARRGRRPASVKGVRKKAVARRAAKPVAQAQATAEIREWARANGFEVGERGAIPGRIRSAYTLAHE
jgi:hypothetical protein